MKNFRVFYLKIFQFLEVRFFYIFEYVCFRNGLIIYDSANALFLYYLLDAHFVKIMSGIANQG